MAPKTPKKKRSGESARPQKKAAPRPGAKAAKKPAKSSKEPLARNGRWRSGALPTTPTDLPPTPKKLLEAARTVFERNGYAGLRLEAIAGESGLAHSLIRYHFGNKDGLVGVLIDWVLYETYVNMHRGFTSLPPEDIRGRLEWMSRGLRRFLRDPVSYRLYLDLVVAALHDEDLRPKLAESFVGQRRLILEAVEPDADHLPQEEAAALAAIVVAFSDGLAMQYLADPAGMDLDRIFKVWDAMMEQASLPPASPGSTDPEDERDPAGDEP